MTDPTTPADNALFAAIGRLTISWAFVEAGLTYATMSLHHDFGGQQIDRELPWALKSKLKYIRKCFRKIDILKGSAGPVCELMDDIQAASELRHDIIHGTATEHPEGASQIEMVRILRGSDVYSARTFSVNTQQILEAAIQADKLGGATLALAQLLMDHPAPPASETG